MDKRYQIFISSTYKDLQEERQAAMRGVLEMNHMPAGMELFPATDDKAWELIKEIIDVSDYYVLILGGRYGSLDEEGLSFTEKEYDYAHSNEIPVVAILHENPNNLPRGDTEIDPAGWKKLKTFRKKVEDTHTCTYWNSVKDLKLNVIVSLTSEIKRHPGVGWVKANELPSGDVANEVTRLSSENAELRKKLKEATNKIQKNKSERIDSLLNILTNNKYELFLFYDKELDWKDCGEVLLYDVFYKLAPEIMIETSTFHAAIVLAVNFDPDETNKLRSSWPIPENEMKSWISDLIALELVEPSMQRHSVNDTNEYWTITDLGREIYTSIRRKRLEEGKPTQVEEKPKDIEEPRT